MSSKFIEERMSKVFYFCKVQRISPGSAADLMKIMKESLELQRQKMIEKIEKIKPDERKVLEFNQYVAESYDEKMFARDVFDKAIDIIKSI